jgi:hypothetical protein
LPRKILALAGSCSRLLPAEPRGHKRGKKHPAILEIHGGPHALYGVGFFHEFQLLAANGYMVVYSNPRGSKGYGRDHCAAIRGSSGARMPSGEHATREPIASTDRRLSDFGRAACDSWRRGVIVPPGVGVDLRRPGSFASVGSGRELAQSLPSSRGDPPAPSHRKGSAAIDAAVMAKQKFGG